MPAIAAVVAQIVASPAPIICFDTCSLIDIVRDPVKKPEADLQRAQHIMRLLQAAESNPPRLHVVIPHQATVEIDDHQASETAIATKSLEGTTELVARIHAVTTCFGGTPPVYPTMAQLGFEQAAAAILDRFKRRAHVLEEDDDIVARSVQRARNGLAPGKRGGAIKDCLVIETCLEFMRQLRERGNVSVAVFISANKHDYCADGRTLHPELEPDFGAVNLLYALNFATAQGQLHAALGVP